MVTVNVFLPKPELASFVGRIIIFQYNFAKELPLTPNPFPPNPYHTLYFYPRSSVEVRNPSDRKWYHVPPSLIVGPKLSRVDLKLSDEAIVVMVHFNPGGLHRWLRVPMNELLDNSVDASLVLGPSIQQVIESLRACVGLVNMNEIVQRYLIAQVSGLKATLPIDLVLARIQSGTSMKSVDALASESCVSTRQFERQFHERIGINPKTYLRLTRFSAAWNMRETTPTLSWMKIAHTCGYADQMHLIRDFKEFLGGSPSSVSGDSSKGLVRVPRW